MAHTERGQMAISNQSVDGHIGHGQGLGNLPDAQKPAFGTGRFAHMGSVTNNYNNFNDRHNQNSGNNPIN